MECNVFYVMRRLMVEG